jgi:hypothetical protein
MLVSALYYLFKVYGFDVFVINNPRIPTYHVHIVNFLVLASLTIFYIASVSNPGVINKKNIKSILSIREYDYILYDDYNSICNKCTIIKPARSKHCNICNICVDKFDHHCIWVNNCIGSNNYRYFILYLFTHLLLTAVSFVIGMNILLDHIQNKKMLEMKFVNKTTGEELETNYMTILKYITYHYYGFFSCLLMLLVIAIVLFFFFFYHVYLLEINYTSNETNKRGRTFRFYKLVKKTTKLYLEKMKDNKEFQKDLESCCEVVMTDVIKKKCKTFCLSKLISFNFFYIIIIILGEDSDITKLSAKDVVELVKFSEFMIENSYKNVYDKGVMGNIKEVFFGNTLK